MFFIKDEIVDLCSTLRVQVFPFSFSFCLSLSHFLSPNNNALQCIPLVDSFGLSDTLLRSPLGRYDGNVYEHYFER